MPINIENVPIGAMKILSCYKEVQQILAGKMPVPRTMELHVSNVCNHACIGCHSRHQHRGEPQFLDFEKVKEIVSELAELGVEGVEISGGGEPLMYPQIIPAIAYMRSQGLRVGIFSNGTLLNRELSEFLVQNLLFLRIAFDVSSKETYKEIHGRDMFDCLHENLQTIVQVRAELLERSNRGRLGDRGHLGVATLGAKCLVSQKNWRELPEAAAMAREIGLDYLQFKCLRNSRFTLEGEELEAARREAERARQEATDDFRVFGSLEKTTVIGRCFLNPIHPVIDAAGDMYLCAFYHHREQEHRIGNVYEKSFPEIWYSERHFEAFRSSNPEKCAVFDCPFHEAAILAKAWIVENQKHLEFI
jgi:radical SAM protein with 4Fe4S-binding SPASM domain